MPLRLLFSSLAIVLLAGCGSLDSLPQALRPSTPWESFASSLRQAELAETPLGRAWLAAGSTALAQAPAVEPPFQEILYFDPREPSAVGYRLALRRGQRLTVELSAPPTTSGRCFVDLFAASPDGGGDLELAAHAAAGSDLGYEAGEDATFVLRLQPELLAGGQYTVTVRVEGLLSFPVAGRDSRAIKSFFGDPRSGGQRRHEGVDIFAPRGTAAVAADRGIVTRVGENRLGGRVVWMQTAGGLSLYYAHLEEQEVRTGERVSAGEVLGRVGNTGNARDTPPHLHFSIYDRGAVDPYPYLHRPLRGPAEVEVDRRWLGEWGRVRRARVHLRQAPTTRSESLQRLGRNTVVSLIGGQKDWYRVELPGGEKGYVFSDLIEPADPLRTVSFDRGRPILLRPDALAPVLGQLEAQTEVSKLGEYGDHLLITTQEALTGWIAGG